MTRLHSFPHVHASRIPSHRLRIAGKSDFLIAPRRLLTCVVGCEDVVVLQSLFRSKTSYAPLLELVVVLCVNQSGPSRHPSACNPNKIPRDS